MRNPEKRKDSRRLLNSMATWASVLSDVVTQ
jgi:hypothetical protein